MILKILFFVLILLIVLMIIKKYRKNTEKKEHEKYASVIKKAMQQVELDLKDNHFQIIKENYIGDVWGRDIELYNFLIKVKKGNDLRDKIEQSLNGYCKKQKLINKYGIMIKISDFWFKDNNLELDLVLLVNDKTKEYLDDIHRI